MVGDLIRLPLVGKVNVWLYKLPPEWLKLSDLNVRFSLEGIDFDLGDIEIDFWEGLKDMGKGFAESLYFEKDPEDEKKVILRSEGQKVAAIKLESKEKAEELVNISQQTHKASFPVNGGQLKLIFPNTPQARCDEVAALLNKYSDKFGINTPLRMAHFLGQTGFETSGYTANKSAESGCYTPTNPSWSDKGWIMNKKWSEPTFVEGCLGYTGSKRGTKKLPWRSIDDVPAKYICGNGNSSENATKNLFSYVYQCEGGNGDESTQEGYRYRGHGWIQLTWKKQYVQFNNWMKENTPAHHRDVVDNPDLLGTDKTIDALSGMWYWQENEINNTADGVKEGSSLRQFEAVTKKINKAGLHNDKRKEIFDRTIAILK